MPPIHPAHQAIPRRIKQPGLLAVMLTLLQLAFPVISGTIIAINQLSEPTGRLIQAAFFSVAGIVGCVIARRLFKSLPAIGLKDIGQRDGKIFLWFLPLIVIEGLSLAFGFKAVASPEIILIYLFFTAAVGFSEEVYFRGLIPQVLRSYGLVRTLVGSSVLFASGHFFNLLAGAGLIETSLQVVFAFLFGLVALQIRWLSGSLIIPVVWHWLHNFLSLITRANDSQASLLFGLFQGTVLVGYAIFLGDKLKSQTTVGQPPDLV